MKRSSRLSAPLARALLAAAAALGFALGARSQPGAAGVSACGAEAQPAAAQGFLAYVRPAQDRQLPGRDRTRPPQRPGGKPGIKKTCADCHADFLATLRGKEPHFEGLGQRCEDCHERHGLVGVLKLKASEPDLCLGCHADAGRYASAEHGHPPAGTPLPAAPDPKPGAKPDPKPGPKPGAKAGLGADAKPLAAGACSSCHDPHAAEGRGLLVAQGPELCFRCHEREGYTGADVHAPIAQGCLACHSAHSDGQPGGLTKKAPELCNGCHDVRKQEAVTAHSGYDLSRSDCNDCHSPHRSKLAGLVRPFVHEPARDDCTSCHLEPDEIAPDVAQAAFPPLRAPAEKLCGVCHGEKIHEFGARPSAHAPVAGGACLDCHVVHASEHDGLLVAPKDETCRKCHDLSEHLAKLALPNRSPHPPVTEGRCTECHDPHGGAEADLLPAPQNELCLRCHEELKPALERKVVHAALELCTSCHAGHGSEQPAALRAGGANVCIGCHKDLGERFRNEAMHKPVALGDCLVCHDPHASDHDGMLRKPGAESCTACHAEVTHSGEGGSVHAPAKKGDCLVCHDPHSAPRAGLLKSEPGELCASCHGITQKEITGAAFAHPPAAAGACLACHSAHASPREHLLSQGPRETCVACHGEVENEALQPGVLAHDPLKKGECLGCHDPHGSAHPAITRAPGNELCAKCHDVASRDLAAKHLGESLAKADCLSCHTPHSAPGEGLIWPERHAPFAEKRCQECHEPQK